MKTIFLFLFCFSIQIANAQSRDTLYTWGLPDIQKINATRIISEKWKIYRYGIGCVTNEWLEDSLTRLNNITYNKLIPKHGRGWIDRYYQEIERETEIELMIDSLVKKQKFMEGLDLSNPLPGSPLPMYPIDNKGNYIVTVNHYYGKDWKEQKLYQLQVNYKRKSIKIIKDYMNHPKQ